MDEFLRRLADGGDLVTVSRCVDTEFELAAVTQRLQAAGNQAVLFTDVRDSELPVVSNVFGSRARLGAIVGAGERGFARALHGVTVGARHSDPYPPHLVGHSNRGSLSDLPIPRYSAHDGGAYITGGVFLAQDPQTGVPNLSFHRAMYVSDRQLRVRLAPGHHLTRYHGTAERLGRPLDAAILISVSPHLFLAAAARLPYARSELELAATLAGRPLPTRPGRTVELDIPLDADIVVEGRFLPGARAPEGPFGEFMGYYVEVADNPIFEVTDVSWREGAVFHSINCGSSEELLPLTLAAAAETYRLLSERVSGVVDVVRHPRINHDVVAITQQHAGHADAVLAELAGMPHVRMCSIVDADVDIYDLTDVLWAMATRGRPGAVTRRDPVPSFDHDPQLAWGRFAVNACVPFDQGPAYRRKHIPGATDLNLADYLG
jgi:4-hydroxybenzoate decarboxylase